MVIVCAAGVIYAYYHLTQKQIKTKSELSMDTGFTIPKPFMENVSGRNC